MKLLLRFAGELLLKSSRVSNRFQRTLLANLKAALRAQKCQFSVEPHWSRIFVCVDKDSALDAVCQVFGIQYVAVIDGEVAADLDAIVAKGLELYGASLEGKSFAVKARRSGTHSYNSLAVNQQLGAALKACCSTARVDLGNAELNVHVDIIQDRAYFYSEKVPGAGGLPLETGGKAVSLVSGGFDSIVATWMIQRRGVALDYIFCRIGGKANERAVLRILRDFARRWYHAPCGPKVYLVDFNPIVEEIRSKAPGAYAQVLLKRFFYLLAAAIARADDADGIVTGEAIGQVSSQTLKNLRAIEDGIDYPLLRPLISFTKDDIVTLSHKVGNFAASSKIREYCQIVPAKPVTASSVDRVQDLASCFDSKALIDAAISQARVLRLSELNDAELVDSYLFTSEITSDTCVIDCQSKAERDQASIPDSSHWEFYEFMRKIKTFARDKRYVIYCRQGTQSALLAEEMQSHGYEAYSLRGGLESYSGPLSGSGVKT